METPFQPQGTTGNVVQLQPKKESKLRKTLFKVSWIKKAKLGMFILAFALIGGLYIFKSSASPAIIATLQAEQMKASDSWISVVGDSSASGGSAVKFTDTGGNLSGTVTLSGNTTTLTVIAKASSCKRNGWPDIKVSVDGSNVLPKTVVNSSSWASYSANVKLTAASHKVVLTYPDSTTRCTPTLYIDAITFTGPDAATPPPTVTLSANPTTIASGQTSTLSWNSVNATSCTASGEWTGAQSTSGTYTTSALTKNATYSLSCTGSGGSASTSSTVTVTTIAPGPPPTPPPTSTGIWKPTADKPISFHWVLGETLNVNDPVQMGLRDLNGNTLPAPDVYDIDGEYNSAATVSYLHSQGKKVICYFDAGVYETYRSDAYKFQALSPQIWGNKDEGWDGSYWLDIRRINELKPIMEARIQMCKDKGFDAIEPDEITNWSNNPGFPITYNDQIAYNKAIAGWAHAAGLSIGLKGDLEQAHDLVNDFDWALTEECYQFNECTTVSNSGGPGADDKDYPGLQLFVQQNKAVWIAEYKKYTTTEWSNICSDSQKNKFNTYLFRLGLPNNGGRQPCITTNSPSW